MFLWAPDYGFETDLNLWFNVHEKAQGFSSWAVIQACFKVFIPVIDMLS